MQSSLSFELKGIQDFFLANNTGKTVHVKLEEDPQRAEHLGAGCLLSSPVKGMSYTTFLIEHLGPLLAV